MSGSQIVVGDDYEGLGSLGEVGADMLVIKISLKTQKRSLKASISRSHCVLEVAFCKRWSESCGSKRLASVGTTTKFEFAPTEDMVEDALLKVVDAIANEGSNKIEQWWSKMSAAKEADQLTKNSNECSYRIAEPSWWCC